MFQVIFTYDEATKKWEPSVQGARDGIEARQGFSAVVLSCQQLNPALLLHTKVDSTGWVEYKITPAV